MSDNSLLTAAGRAFTALDRTLLAYQPRPTPQEVGWIERVGEGVVWTSGLGRVRSEELLQLGHGSRQVQGMALDILPDRLGVVLLGSAAKLAAGDEVRRSGQVLSVPVGNDLLGRVVGALGEPMDDGGPVRAEAHWPIHREAPPIMHRAPVSQPLQTGLKAVDALIPVGRGQRELILGDRQTGKTAIAEAAIINQRGNDVVCVYCAIAQRSSATAKVVANLRSYGAMDYTTVVVVEADDAPGRQYIAPYAATSMAEYFMSQGRDVLIIYDDLTRHARAYRELSLLLRRPPGREAYPGDIFYIHSRMLERATRMRPEHGGGSLTALPIIETQAQNLSAYIPTNLISITDGQIYLNPDLFQKSILPAVDVGKSVSRVGGKAQSPAYRRVAGDLKLAYSQFQELEKFSRFGTRLDEATRARLEHGRRVREMLKQEEFDLFATPEQIAVLYATVEGLLDTLPLAKLEAAQQRMRDTVHADRELADRLMAADKHDPVWDELGQRLRQVLSEL